MKTTCGIVGAICMLISVDALWYPFPAEIRGWLLTTVVTAVLATGFVVGYCAFGVVKELLFPHGRLR